MKYDPRRGRSLFLAYIGCAYVLVLIAAPLATALGRSSIMSASSGSSGRSSCAVTFERFDRNGDGVIDKVEFGRALGMLETCR